MHKMEFAKGLHQKALAIVSRYKKSEFELIEILEQVDRHKIFYQLGFGSLFEYAVKGLGLSEAVSYIYIRVARKTREVPALKEEIKGGHISVSKATKIAAVVTKENQSHWLELAKFSSKRELEKQIALARPKDAIAEKMDFISDAHEQVSLKAYNKCVRVRVQLGISEKLMLQFRRAQDVLSQRRRKSVSLEEVLEEIVPLYLAKEDPVEIAKRQEIRGKLKKQLVPGRVSHTPQDRKPIGSGLRHRVFLKYKGQCGHIDEHGNRCQSRRFLDVHHIEMVSLGGMNDFDNLTLLCSGHHKMIHAQKPPPR